MTMRGTSDAQYPTNLTCVLALCVFSGVLLLLFGSRELSGMSMGAAASAVLGEWSFMPHHLLYKPLLQAFSQVSAPLGCDAVCIGQWHSIAWALAAIASTFVIVRTLTGSLVVSSVAALFLLGAKGFWVYATQLEAYSLVVGTNAVIAAFLITRMDRDLTVRDITIVTVLFTWSLFFHQVNVFFLVPLALFLYMAYGARGLKTAFWIMAIAGVVSASVNAFIFWSLYPGESFGDFYRWLTYYGVISNDTHGSWMEIITLDFARISGAFRQTVKVFLEVPEGDLQKPLRLLFFGLVLATVAWNLLSVWKKMPHRAERSFLLAIAIGFGFFGYWWQPNVYKFYLFIVMPLTVLGALMVNDIAGVLRQATVPRLAFVGVISVILVGTIGLNIAGTPRALNSDRSPIFDLSANLSDATPENCSIYTIRALTGFLGYYHGRESRPFNLMYRKYQYGFNDADAARALRVSIDMKTEECAVIPLYWMSEGYFHTRNRSTRLVDSRADTEYVSPEWGAFVDWILNVEPDSTGQRISYDDYEIFLHEDAAYVRIDRRHRSVADSSRDLTSAIGDAVRDNPLGGIAGDEYRQTGDFRGRAFGYF